MGQDLPPRVEVLTLGQGKRASHTPQNCCTPTLPRALKDRRAKALDIFYIVESVFKIKLGFIGLVSPWQVSVPHAYTPSVPSMEFLLLLGQDLKTRLELEPPRAGDRNQMSFKDPSQTFWDPMDGWNAWQNPFPDCSQPPATLGSCTWVCGTPWVGGISELHAEEWRAGGPRVVAAAGSTPLSC